MFYDLNLMKNKTIGNVWRVAHNVNTDAEILRELPKICNKIDRWNWSGKVRKRLSLRTSSTLLAGAAKLYRIGVQEVMDELNELDGNLFFRRRRFRESSNTGSTSSADQSDFTFYPKETRLLGDSCSETPISPRNSEGEENPDGSTSPILGAPQRLRNGDHSTGSPPTSRHSTTIRRSSRTTGSDPFSEDNINLSPVIVQKSLSRRRREQGTQTSSKSRPGNNDSVLEDGFNVNLPFGHVLIHDSYFSRIPSRILCCSLNRDVTKIIDNRLTRDREINE